MNALEKLTQQIDLMSDDGKADIAALVKDELNKPWRPQPGPQTMAYTSEADIILYGGAAGGGKSDLIIGMGLNNHHRVGVFRQQSGELTGLVDRMDVILEAGGLGKVTGNPQKWNGPDRAKFEFGHLERPGSEKSWQGRDHDLKCFDEAAQINPAKIIYVMGWNRSTRPGQKCQTLLCSNPPIGGDGAYLIEWFAPWLNPLHELYGTVKPGELLWAVFVGTGDEVHTVWTDGPEPFEIDGKMRTPKSRTFIPAKLEDNKYLGEDYRATIDSLPEPMRTALLTGDFMSAQQDHDFQIIPSDWIQAAMDRWVDRAPAPMDVLGVDVAQGGSDKTTLAPLHGVWFGKITKRKGVDTRDGEAVGMLVVGVRRNGCLVAVDCTGGWGGDTVGFLERDQHITCEKVVFSSKSTARAKDSGLEFYNLRAQMYWQIREALHPKSGDNLCLPPNQALKAQLAAHRWVLRGKKILVEDKQEIKKRTGSSPDESDAVVIAWNKRDTGVFLRVKGQSQSTTQAPIEDPL